MLKFLSSVSAAGLLALVLGATSASATSITVANFSFETPGSTNGGTGCPITGWTCSSNNSLMGVYVPASGTQYSGGSDGVVGVVPDGSQAAYSNVGGGTFSQITAAVFGDSTTYTLGVYVGHRADFGEPSPVGTIELTAGPAGTLVTSVAMTDPGAGKWLLETLTYSTTTGVGDPFSGQTIGIKFIDGGASGQLNLDDVTLNAVTAATGGGTVPEPITLSIFGAGLAGAAALRRRRHRG